MRSSAATITNAFDQPTSVMVITTVSLVRMRRTAKVRDSVLEVLYFPQVYVINQIGKFHHHR